MIYTSGTTGKPKGALRTSAGDPQQGAALLGLIGYRPDDVYLTTGPLYHSGPGGFMGVAQTLGQHRDRPAQVRSGRLAAPRRHLQGHVDLLRADAHPDDLQPARRREGEVRPQLDARS